MRSPIIKLSHVSLNLGKTPVLSDISLDVFAGEFITILGPNGAGKSTLLKLLLGLYKPTGGHVEIFGRKPKTGNNNIGYAPQHRTLEADLALRARDVVGFGLDGNRWGIGLPNRHRDKAVDAVLTEVGMARFADKPVGKLSGGQQQLLLIAQALLTSPQILLLDEPLANLDISRARDVISLVKKLNADKKITVLLVTHDINPLLPVTERVIYLARTHGFIGTPDEVITSRQLSKLYGSAVEVIRTQGKIFVIGEHL